MMKKGKIIVTLGLALTSLTVFAQTDETQRPTPTLQRQEAGTARQDAANRIAEERKIQLEKNRAEQATMRAEGEAKRKAQAEAMKVERQNAVEDRQTMRVDATA
ncbi:MAG: hypothetical protein NUV54_02910, partial [Candidatus Taylorbacteria bacterium]|nr:hypothetical protein [Candidatus Taylorbacteria bacterium]